MSGPDPLADLHTHVTPGVDDGAVDADHALRYLREDVERGVRRVMATPHLPASWAGSSYRREAERSFRSLRTRVRRDLPRLELQLAFEVRLDGGGVDPRDQGLWLGPGGHVLVEFDGFRVPPDPLAPMRPLLEEGLRPVLAHPERFRGAGDELAWADELREAGVLLCLNAGSLIGTHGDRAGRGARKLLARGAVDLVASDQHARPDRAESVADVAELLSAAGERAAARTLLWTNPVALLDGEEPEPAPGVELDAVRSEGASSLGVEGGA